MARRIALIALIALQPRRQLRVQVFVDLIEQQNLTTSQSGDRRPDEREPGQQISDRASDGPLTQQRIKIRSIASAPHVTTGRNSCKGRPTLL
jgi:hypothetical protein